MILISPCMLRNKREGGGHALFAFMDPLVDPFTDPLVDPFMDPYH